MPAEGIDGIAACHAFATMPIVPHYCLERLSRNARNCLATACGFSQPRAIPGATPPFAAAMRRAGPPDGGFLRGVLVEAEAREVEAFGFTLQRQSVGELVRRTAWVNSSQDRSTSSRRGTAWVSSSQNRSTSSQRGAQRG